MGFLATRDAPTFDQRMFEQHVEYEENNKLTFKLNLIWMAQNKRHRADDDLAQFMLAILYK